MVTYSSTAVDDRLQGVVNAIDAGGTNGNLRLLAGSTVICTFSLARPCGTVSGGVLTFSGTLIDTSAAETGNVTGARIEDSNGNVAISGLTIGTSTMGAYDGYVLNGLGTTLITVGQVVSANVTITGAA